MAERYITLELQMLPFFVFVLVGVIHAFFWAFLLVESGPPTLYVYEIDGQLMGLGTDERGYGHDYRDRISFPRLKYPFICSSVVVNGLTTYWVWSGFNDFQLRTGFADKNDFIDYFFVIVIFVLVLIFAHGVYCCMGLLTLSICYTLDEEHESAIRIAHVIQQTNELIEKEQNMNTRKERIRHPNYLHEVQAAHERDLEKGLKSIHTRLAALRNETRPIRIRQAEVLVTRMPIDLVGRVFEFL